MINDVIALLYEYCTQPHALTVMAIILLGRHNKQVIIMSKISYF
jgi:hypothetical protein